MPTEDPLVNMILKTEEVDDNIYPFLKDNLTRKKEDASNVLRKATLPKIVYFKR